LRTPHRACSAGRHSTPCPRHAAGKIAAPLSGVLDANGRADFRLTGLTIDAFTLSAFYAGDNRTCRQARDPSMSW
jgi:hypothetical protein